MDSCDSTGRSSSYGGIQEKRRDTAYQKSFLTGLRLFILFLNHRISLLYFTACNCWKV